MGKTKTASRGTRLRPRLRVMLGSEIALGPGRVDLLESVQKTGSLRAAAKKLGMSYMRAWHLVKYTNRCFGESLVEVARGGKMGGGARLTGVGRQVVELYRRLERESQRATQAGWKELRKLLKT